LPPKVTVLMPVFNGEKYVRSAIDSILAQSLPDFEFLIINDGSSDDSVKIIESYSDNRIRLVHNTSNQGVVKTLNRGLDLATGQYIARMDCDDISLPDRFAKQVHFMDTHPQIGACGTWVKTFGSSSKDDVWKFPSDPNMIRCRLLFETVLAHPSVIIRKNSFDKHNLRYDIAYLHAEDFELWKRASRLFPLANIPEVLVLYRITPDSVARSNREAQLSTLRRIDLEALTEMGINANNDELSLHRRLALYQFKSSLAFLSTAEQWLFKILAVNESTRVYPRKELQEVTAAKWLHACRAAARDGVPVLKIIYNSSLLNAVHNSQFTKIKITLSCLLGAKKQRISRRAKRIFSGA
jgi:glycosyltransferase involved in cell wall biosynthesis